jgi:hypothetical protein
LTDLQIGGKVAGIQYSLHGVLVLMT